MACGLETYVFNQRSLVFECVTLAEVIELMVKVLVNLARGTVLYKETTENSLTAHPENLTEDTNHQKHSLATPTTITHEITDEREIAIGGKGNRRDNHTYLGILASLVPFLLPRPLCLPIRREVASSRARARECMVTGFLMISPSLTSFRIVWRELALEISFTSFGSSQTLRLPQPITEAARRF
jgi:hypothetical protein